MPLGSVSMCAASCGMSRPPPPPCSGCWRWVAAKKPAPAAMPALPPADEGSAPGPAEPRGLSEGTNKPAVTSALLRRGDTCSGSRPGSGSSHWSAPGVS